MGTAPVCNEKTCTYKIEVFNKENYCSSLQAAGNDPNAKLTRSVEITVPKRANTFSGEYVELLKPYHRGMSFKELLDIPLYEIGKYSPDAHFNEEGAYKNVYFIAENFLKFVSDELKFDYHMFREIPREGIAGKDHRLLKIMVNEGYFRNAMYIPPPEEMCVFGDGDGPYAMGLDGDIIVHELCHAVVDVINPFLGSSFVSAGTSDHEGSCDAVPTQYHGDYQMAEDFGFLMPGRNCNWGGMRSVNNTATFQKMFAKGEFDLDPHEIGKIYSGFFTDLSKKLKDLLKKNAGMCFADSDALDRLARVATMKIIFAHFAVYPHSPTFGDFKDSVLAGSRELFESGLIKELSGNGVNLPMISTEIILLSKERGFDWIAEKMCLENAPTADQLKDISTDKEPIGVVKFGKRATKYYQQRYKTKFGNLAVLGHGRAVTVGKYGETERNKGLVHLKPGLFTDVTPKNKNNLQATLAREVEKALEKKYKGKDKADPKDTKLKYLQAYAKGAIEEGKKEDNFGELAVLVKNLPKKVEGPYCPIEEPKLVWYFKSKALEVAIDAETGKILDVNVNVRIS